ncbi:hypothetical protein [Bradyrhizobium arachidis]|uniref:hypothetical protein n=1 Tax=Bradyrhizobium arachidis TaxID=858423 RepID=UPI000B84C54A|nr:hypothetical protein [Bradyrhizobium arachidis]
MLTLGWRIAFLLALCFRPQLCLRWVGAVFSDDAVRLVIVGWKIGRLPIARIGGHGLLVG